MNILHSLQAMDKIILLLFFYKYGFGMKNTRKVDIPLNKEPHPTKMKKYIIL